jgi:hypothetical protein
MKFYPSENSLFGLFHKKTIRLDGDLISFLLDFFYQVFCAVNFKTITNLLSQKLIS